MSSAAEVRAKAQRYGVSLKPVHEEFGVVVCLLAELQLTLPTAT